MKIFRVERAEALLCIHDCLVYCANTDATGRMVSNTAHVLRWHFRVASCALHTARKM